MIVDLKTITQTLTQTYKQTPATCCTPSNILLVSMESAVCVWVLGTVGDYIHPAVGSLRGEGGNVIYTLIMPAPLNTPADGCNILDISSFFLLTLSPSFRSLPSIPDIPGPMLIFALLMMHTEQ